MNRSQVRRLVHAHDAVLRAELISELEAIRQEIEAAGRVKPRADEGRRIRAIERRLDEIPDPEAARVQQLQAEWLTYREPGSTTSRDDYEYRQ